MLTMVLMNIVQNLAFCTGRFYVCTFIFRKIPQISSTNISILDKIAKADLAFIISQTTLYSVPNSAEFHVTKICKLVNILN